MTRSIECAIADPSIDAAIFILSPGLFFLKAAIDPASQMTAIQEAVDKQARVILDPLIKLDHENAHRKPLVMVFREDLARFFPGQEEQLRHELLKEGIPVYFSLERASRAMGKFSRYYEFHRK
jgi:hypothetical protein